MVPINDAVLHVTISVGVAEADAACADITTLLAQADAAMYHAKSNGRNRVHSDSPTAHGPGHTLLHEEADASHTQAANSNSSIEAST